MYAISPTDIDWFHYLLATGFNSQINFWTPTPWNVSKLSLGDKLYFMLKSPIRKIGGYGHFQEYKNMTVNEAWSHFGFKNGCSSKQELVERLDKYKSNRSTDQRSVLESEIGCIVLNNAEFFDDNQFKNGSKNVAIRLENFGQQSNFYVVLNTISFSNYRFQLSKAANGFSDGFFSEPVQIFSNVSGGYGIMSGKTSSRSLIQY